MAEAETPGPRTYPESALIGDELYLFGGMEAILPHAVICYPRNEIWTCNVREEKKWIRHFAEGSIPPPCWGAQCVVINGIVYSYGGETEDGEGLEEVFALNPKKMKWIQVATPAHRKKPWHRSCCCLWAIGGRMIMFGGESDDDFRNDDLNHRDYLQSGAQRKGYVNNEIYEFVFEEGREKGYWLDVELSGERPQPRSGAAVEMIDQHRGLLHGGYAGGEPLDDAFVIDLIEKKWICINFLPKPSARSDHKICQLSKTGFVKNCFLLIGGFNRRKFSDYACILDFEQRKSYAFELTREMEDIFRHSLHCVENRDGSAQIIVTGGEDPKNESKKILTEFTLGPSNDSYMQIETKILKELREKRMDSIKS
ncbi:actin-fragmin kinase-like isoform X2 [Oscarella lobularis]|uniref:actin-fragmin kinase-like isoform X2 n=1 Tax=Oscarella lobularis TaxID=121494 RepID=UPI0033142303